MKKIRAIECGFNPRKGKMIIDTKTAPTLTLKEREILASYNSLNPSQELNHLYEIVDREYEDERVDGCEYMFCVFKLKPHDQLWAFSYCVTPDEVEFDNPWPSPHVFKVNSQLVTKRVFYIDKSDDIMAKMKGK